MSANPTKWPNTLKQFAGKLPTNCLSVFGHFVNLALKGLTVCLFAVTRRRNESVGRLVIYFFFVEDWIFLNFWIFLKFYSFTSSRPEVFLKNAVLKIYSKFTREDPCRSATSIRFLGNFIEISLRHGCSPVNLMDIFKTAFAKKTSGRLLLFFNLRVTLLLCLSVIVTVIKVYPEAVPRRFSLKKILKNSQNPQIWNF